VQLKHRDSSRLIGMITIPIVMHVIIQSLLRMSRGRKTLFCELSRFEQDLEAVGSAVVARAEEPRHYRKLLRYVTA
jgi:hypothetical protein